MTPILGTMASQISGHLAVPNNFESIATVLVGSGGTATISFTSIPGTYQHLQIRGVAKIPSGGGMWGTIKFNSDSTSGNYYGHRNLGNGSAASHGVNVGTSGGADWTTVYDSTFIPFVTDILDYANTSKGKTLKTLSGWDSNTVGEINYMGGMWTSTSAITRIDFAGTSNFAEYSHFALYGVK